METNQARERVQAEAVAAASGGRQGRLLLAPRSGKTKIVLDVIRNDDPGCTLWVAPEAKLVREDIPSEFRKWGMESYLSRLDTVTWASLNKVRGHYSLIVLDEEQHATENRLRPLLDGTLGGRVLSMTGTPSKHFEKQLLYNRLCLPVLYEVPISEAVDGGILADYAITVVSVPMSEGRDMWTRGKKPFRTSEKSLYEWLDAKAEEAIASGANAMPLVMARRRAVHRSPSKLACARAMKKLEGRKVFFCADIAQAEAIGVPTFHSRTDKEAYRAFQRGDLDSIAMVNSGGTGHTYQGVNHLIVVQADSDRNGLTTQKIARALLAQEGYKAEVWMLRLEGTKDEDWTASALQNFDQNKVRHKRWTP